MKTLEQLIELVAKKGVYSYNYNHYVLGLEEIYEYKDENDDIGKLVGGKQQDSTIFEREGGISIMCLENNEQKGVTSCMEMQQYFPTYEALEQAQLIRCARTHYRVGANGYLQLGCQTGTIQKAIKGIR